MMAHSSLPLIDAHLDLAWNALSFNRDLTSPLDDVRSADRLYTDAPYRGSNLISLDELSDAHLHICIATLLARSGPNPPPSMLRIELDYAHPSISHAHAHGQLAYYKWLETSQHARIIHSADDLDQHWENPKTLGLILSFEGCDPILNLDDLHRWHHLGVRAAGLTHYGEGRYAGGTNSTTGLTRDGHLLLKEFESLGMILDVTHLSDESINSVFDIFDGHIIASHHNCRSLVPGQRQLSDQHIRELLDRKAVIGISFDAWMLYPNWKRNETDRSVVSLSSAVDHIDHICDLAGNSEHVGIGSDLDGGFGLEQTPTGLDRYSSLQSMEILLSQRGYSNIDIHNIFYNNWLNFFRKSLPQSS
ncbi:MAG: membrane dipeptidase [Bacteroidetes bacterium]|nr:membrane dipeptidase [Bacteroidota bacterium]